MNSGRRGVWSGNFTIRREEIHDPELLQVVPILPFSLQQRSNVPQDQGEPCRITRTFHTGLRIDVSIVQFWISALLVAHGLAMAVTSRTYSSTKTTRQLYADQYISTFRLSCRQRIIPYTILFLRPCLTVHLNADARSWKEPTIARRRQMFARNLRRDGLHRWPGTLGRHRWPG